MISLLLAVIYLAFISLGLPDSLLGSAWPVMYRDLDVPLSFAGIITFIVSCGTVVSSLLSDRMTRRFGAGKVTSFSVLMTALALLGFSFSGRFWILCIMAIPYGLGAGGVDAALNNYVALHYTSRHMNWLHCFWGVGITASPYIMSSCLVNGARWNAGYLTVSLVQIIIAGLLFVSLPAWRVFKNADEPKIGTASGRRPAGITEALRIPGVKAALTGFFGYCALETTTGLWASTYLFLYRNVPENTAARCGAYFFIGITAGRFISGFISDGIGDRNMIRAGLSVVAAGLFAMIIPAETPWPALAGLLLTGLGCAPVYPAVIHETPDNFGKDNSQSIIGIQMACAYIGSSVIPPVFGIVAQYAGVIWFPYCLIMFLILMFTMLERTNRIIDSRKGKSK